MSQGEKICVHCGQSCANQARVKDGKGNYAHTACAEKHKNAKQGETGRSGPPAGGSQGEPAGTMAAILSDIDDKDMIGGEHSCQGCGYPMEDDAMICLHCGFNRETGRQFGTKVARDPNKPTKSGAALNIGATAGGAALAPFLPLAGACVGGLIGAGIWGGIAYQFNIEFGWIAILVGVLCGLGAGIGARGEGGAIVGGMAALVAIGSISLGKYMAVTWAVDDMFDDEMFGKRTVEQIDDSIALTYVADDIIRDYLDAGRTIEWPNPQIFVDAAVWPDDFPQDISDETWDIWDEMGFTDKATLRRQIAEEYGMRSRDVDDDWALETIAYGLCMERIAEDKPLEWENAYLPLDVSVWPEDYPESIQTQAEQRWVAMTAEEQQDYRVQVRDTINVNLGRDGAISQEIVKDGFVQSFMHPFDLLFIFLAVGAAYKLGAGE